MSMCWGTWGRDPESLTPSSASQGPIKTRQERLGGEGVYGVGYRLGTGVTCACGRGSDGHTMYGGHTVRDVVPIHVGALTLDVPGAPVVQERRVHVRSVHPCEPRRPGVRLMCRFPSAPTPQRRVRLDGPDPRSLCGPYPQISPS